MEEKLQILQSGLSDMKQFFIDKEILPNLNILWLLFTGINAKISQNQADGKSAVRLSTVESEFLKKFATFFAIVHRYSELQNIDLSGGISEEIQQKVNERGAMERKYFRSAMGDNNLTIIKQNMKILLEHATSEQTSDLLDRDAKQRAWCPIL